MRKCCSLFCYPNEGNMAISKNTYYGKQNVPSVRKITATHFVWNQDEAAQNSREAKRFCNMSLHSAQTLRPFCGSRHSFAVIFFLTRHSIPIFINLSFDIPCDYHNFIYIKRRTHYVIEYNSRCRAYPHRYLRQA